MSFKVGDQVIVRKNIQDITPRTPYILISSGMKDLEGRSGVITEIGRNFEEFQITFHRLDNEKSRQLWWAPSWVINTSNLFKEGDRVQILQSIPDVDKKTPWMKWNEDDNENLGKIGTITAIDKEGDLKIALDDPSCQRRFFFSPLWVVPLKTPKRKFAEIEAAVSEISALVANLEKEINA